MPQGPLDDPRVRNGIGAGIIASAVAVPLCGYTYGLCLGVLVGIATGGNIGGGGGGGGGAKPNKAKQRNVENGTGAGGPSSGGTSTSRGGRDGTAAADAADADAAPVAPPQQPPPPTVYVSDLAALTEGMRGYLPGRAHKGGTVTWSTTTRGIVDPTLHNEALSFDVSYRMLGTRGEYIPVPRKAVQPTPEGLFSAVVGAGASAAAGGGAPLVSDATYEVQVREREDETTRSVY